MEKFIQQREVILGNFTKAKEELETLNNDVKGKIESNKQTIAALLEENKQLENIITQNHSTVKKFKQLINI